MLINYKESAQRQNYSARFLVISKKRLKRLKFSINFKEIFNERNG
jgi:hypothetical protein